MPTPVERPTSSEPDGRELLSERIVVANNFATTSDNRIHADDVAAQFGFHGGLVPGVGVFAYMTQPIVEVFGLDWFRSGTITARFRKPVYHGESARVRAWWHSHDAKALSVEVVNPQGVLCADASAGSRSTEDQLPDPADYPRRALPPPDQRFPCRIDSLSIAAEAMGSLELQARSQVPFEGPQAFVDAVCDPLPIYRGPQGVCHPALFVAYANSWLKENVALGPWIHTASQVRYFATVGEGERLTLSGRIARCFERKGHELVELDLVFFDVDDRPVVAIAHEAIVYLARRQPGP